VAATTPGGDLICHLEIRMGADSEEAVCTRRPYFRCPSLNSPYFCRLSLNSPYFRRPSPTTWSEGLGACSGLLVDANSSSFSLPQRLNEPTLKNWNWR
jgi:hypothetical protein